MGRRGEGRKRDNWLPAGFFGIRECLGRPSKRTLLMGIEGRGCEIITTQGGKGLLNTLEVVYPRIERQRCWAHQVHNVLDKVKKADREKIKKDLHQMSHAKNRQFTTQACWGFDRSVGRLTGGSEKLRVRDRRFTFFL